VYSVRQLPDGRFYLAHPRQPGIAWSSECDSWTTLSPFGSSLGFAVDTFDTEDAADEFATENWLYPRRD